ncbi:MAG: DUF1800 domain-containing protein [Saprospiraceae bacterium]|nr:DUF1800 domain-containing protein [Saprospiraceae bacterium]MBK8549321.1 DUF1800 domain-containing protein [Saprospiraceae bacterium]MBK8819698.1 DUF1800 domain-containing protein [Saprospiraceae bacterium]MBK9043863.1 DUF1800 domain-containing protein [Saprospiraceae bacterium]
MSLFLPFLSLAPFSGDWTKQHSAHLLRRATFGASLDQINDFTAKNVGQCVEELMTDLPYPEPPVNINYENDPDVPVGETWVDKATSQGVNGYRRRSLNNWSLELMLKNNPHIREKMTLFWHNHFVIADINEPRVLYNYIVKLRRLSLANFKEMAKEITVDNGMLEYLNGRDNTRQAPNENYARELLELFTLGKGNSVGNGDYTTYTETDIKEIARVLTGWIDVRNTLPIRSEFRAARHDTGTKTLSHRFNNVVIQNAGTEEYKNLIDIIFNREEVALFICRKLYKWFVYHEITAEIENDIIVPLAAIFRQNNYEIKPVLSALLQSEHFYDTCRVGGLVKNPIDFIMTPLNAFSLGLPEDAVVKDRALGGLYGFTNVQQMALFQAPSVAGWQAFYQAPLYNKLWLNSFTLPSRKLYTDALSNTGVPFGNYRLLVDPVLIAEKCDNPEDAEKLISQVSILFSPMDYATNQKTVLLEVLLGTDTRQQWTNKWNTYVADPTNTTKKQAVLVKLRSVFTYMMRMPEFHLS